MNHKEIVDNVIKHIKEIDYKAKEKARIRVDSLAKPLGSLGKLEDISIKLSGITGKVKNKIEKKCIVIFSSDNGVVEEGVASAPQYVTLAQTINFSKGLTGVAVLAKENNTDLLVVDIGVNCEGEIPGAINRKIRKGTNNIAKEAAMTYDECIECIYIGIDMAREAKENRYHILGVGEMGIGNTTTSSSVLASLIGCEIDEVVGKGGGLTDEAFEKKKLVVKRAIEINNPNTDDPIDIVSKVGGFDLAAMVGLFLGGAYYKVPVVIDGFISAVAALVAIKLNILVKEYLIPSHCSKEIGYNIAMKHMDLEPMLNLDMRLGEGSGCPIAFSIVQYACAMMNNMATFSEAEIDPCYLEKVKEERNYIVDRRI
ncbi:nicotinate-nucleotide--dimethylbenzimidazole phosphoribosyltransferase [Clostridium sp. CTA-7]